MTDKKRKLYPDLISWRVVKPPIPKGHRQWLEVKSRKVEDKEAA